MNKQLSKFKKKELSKTDFTIYGKMPPQSPELENAILGAMMLEYGKIEDVIGIIKSEECFYSDANKRIFSSIIRLFDKGSSIDFMTVCEDLRRNSELEIVGGSYYVTSLTRDMVSGANIEEHARIVVEKYMKRFLIAKCMELANDAYEDGSDVFDMLQQAESELSKLLEENVPVSYTHIAEGVDDDLEEIQMHRERIKNEGLALTGVDTGFKTLNAITNGWQSDDLIIIAARPSVGKTAFALNLAMSANVPVGLFTLEMGKKPLRTRIMAMQTEVGLTNITSCQLKDVEFDRLFGNVSKLRGFPLFVDDSSRLTIFDIKNKARRMKKKQGVGLIIIDYLQLMSGSDNFGNREQEISKISRGLKNLAKELSIPIIALSQLNRNVESRKENKEPMLSDIRESGAIEQDADIVAFLYRHDEAIRFKIAKHRNGKIDKIDFNVNYDIQTFKEVGDEFPQSKIKGFSPTEFSGRLIPVQEAMAATVTNLDDEELPF